VQLANCGITASNKYDDVTKVTAEMRGPGIQHIQVGRGRGRSKGIKNPSVCVPPIAAKPHTNKRIINILVLHIMLVNQQAPYYIYMVNLLTKYKNNDFVI